MARHKIEREPDVAAGRFAVVFDSLCLILAVFVSGKLGQKFAGAGCGLSLLAWGSSEIASAKKKEKKKLEKDANKPDA